MAAQVATGRRLAARRGGVSAEPITLSSSSSLSDLNQLKNPKSQEVGERIEKTIKSNILFSALHPDQMQEVLDFMFEVPVKQGDTIIRQGDDGDNFYVVDSGEFEIFISFDNKAPVKVEEVGAKGFFGELALMYNCPRAATVKAKTDGSLWALDRTTFRRVLLETTNKKRRLYESFLENIPILAPLSHYMRTKVSDVLETVYFNDGDFIIRQNEQGDSFFIVEEGEAMAYKEPLAGEPIVELKRIKRGDYCGEIALLRKKPRAANVVAVGPTKCVTLDNDSFTRLLGPCEELFQANMPEIVDTNAATAL